MRLYIFYGCIAVTLLSCTNDINSISQDKAPSPETKKNSSQAITTNNTPANNSATENSNSSGKDCDEQKFGCWNNRMTLW